MEGEGRGGGKPDDRWGLASFFGEEQHALLRLRDETRDLLVDLVATEDKDHGVDGSLDAVTAPATPGDGCGGESTTTGQIDRVVIGNDDDGQACQEPLASVDVPLAFALSENKEKFEEHIRLLRYKDGVVSYQSRNHITSHSWIPENTANGYLSEVTPSFHKSRTIKCIKSI